MSEQGTPRLPRGSSSRRSRFSENEGAGDERRPTTLERERSGASVVSGDGGASERREAAKERMRARAAARRVLRGENNSPPETPTLSGTGGPSSIRQSMMARMKNRRNRLKEQLTSEEQHLEERFEEGSDYDIDDGDNQHHGKPIDAQQLFDLEADAELLGSTRALRPFDDLSSVFAEDLAYANEESSMMVRRGLLHAWQGGVPASRVASRLWRNSVSPHRTIHATNVPEGSDDEDDLSDDGVGRHWSTRWIPLRLMPHKMSKERGEALLNPLLATSDVGLYKPMAPPRARVLLELGPARASDRILYEAAYEDEEAETRLLPLREQYTAEGALRVGADPLEHFHQRPPIVDASAFADAVKVSTGRRGVAETQDDDQHSHSNNAAGAELVVQLSRIALYDHPLFSAEDRLYAELRLLYGEYRRYLEAQTGVYLRSRLDLIIQAAKQQSLETAEPDERTLLASRAVAQDCFETLSLLAAEEQSVTELSEALYTTWNQIKGLRSHQGFASTPAKLVAINVHLASADDDGGRTTKREKMRSQFASVQDLLPWFATYSRKNEQELGACLKKVQSVCSSTSDKESFVLKLHTTVELTRDEDKAIPIHELMRRRRVRQQRLYVVVRANGRKVASTPTSALEWPVFTVNFDRELRLRVARRPVQLQVELWQRRFISDLKLATALVPVPGMSSRHDTATTHSLAPLADWFHFASPNVHWRVTYAQGDEVEAQINVEEQSSEGRCWPSKKRTTKGTWERATVTGVNWSTYDVKTVRGVIQRGVRTGQIRRRGVVFEVRQRQLTGAALVALHWAMKETPQLAPNWDQREQEHGPRGLLPQVAGYGELAVIPPRPAEDDAMLFASGAQQLQAGSTDRYYFAADGSAQGGDMSIFTPNIGKAPGQFDPFDPRNSSLLERNMRSLREDPDNNTGNRFRAVELRRRLAFRFFFNRKPSLHIVDDKLGVAFDDETRTRVPARHRALLMRRSQPTLFPGAIPATDEGVLEDGQTLAVLAKGTAARKNLLLSDRRAGAAAKKKQRREDKKQAEREGAPLLSSSSESEKEDAGDPGQRTRRVKDFVQRIQDLASERGRNYSRGGASSLPLSAVINEGTPIPKLRSRAVVDSALSGLTQRKRALRPPRRRRNANASATDCSLLVQVVSATHMPRSIKKPLTDTTTEDKSKVDLLDSIAAQEAARRRSREAGTFVVASFQEHRRRTMLAAGTSPRWKETLELPFVAPMGDLTPTSLMQCSDALRLAVFSETYEEAQKQQQPTAAGEGEEETTVKNNEVELVPRRVYVGDVSIPFTTLYCNGGTEGFVDGLFKLRTPEIYTGVDHDLHKVKEDDEDELNLESAAAAAPKLLKQGAKASYIHLAIFLRPPLAAPTLAPVLRSMFEEESLMRYAGLWIEQMRLFLETTEDRVGMRVDSRIAKRAIEVFGTNMRGDSVLACRYLRPLKPPPGVDTPAKAARFVSLIPFVEDWQSFGGGRLDVWCTAQEFLDIGAGDWEEHAVLLHNYLWWLSNIEANTTTRDEFFLVIGAGVPEGNTVYVMQRPSGGGKKPDSVIFWNACTGDVCSAADKRLALADIGCLVSPDNVWANMQPVTSPSQLLYDLNNHDNWRPFFNEDDLPKRGYCKCVCFPGPVAYTKPPQLTSVQPPHLRYDEPDVLAAEQIQNALSDELKRRVRKWRSRGQQQQQAPRGDHNMPTSFSVDLSRRLQNLLPQLETLHAQRKLTPAAIERHKRDATGSSRAWDVDAVALHFPYTDLETILERLKATNIHETKLRDLQFVVGVYVHPLVNNLFSVWVYYGTISPKRSVR